MAILALSNTLRAISRSKFPKCLSFSLPSIYQYHFPHHSPPHIHSNSYRGEYNKRVRNVSGIRAFEESGNRGTNVISSPDLVALEYADLNLPRLCQEGGHIRILQHVNPLTSAYSVPAKAPNWKAVYEDSSLPLMVDVGCGSGRFLLWLAKKNIDCQNFLGLEIREKLVKRANFWVKEMGISNAHFIFANATVSSQQLVSSYPGPLVLVSVLVFVQYDVLEVADDMRNQFDSVPGLVHIDSLSPKFICDHDGWLLSNPMGIRTEREVHAELEGAKIYRRMY